MRLLYRVSIATGRSTEKNQHIRTNVGGQIVIIGSVWKGVTSVRKTSFKDLQLAWLGAKETMNDACGKLYWPETKSNDQQQSPYGNLPTLQANWES